MNRVCLDFNFLALMFRSIGCHTFVRSTHVQAARPVSLMIRPQTSALDTVTSSLVAYSVYKYMVIYFEAPLDNYLVIFP